MTEREKEWGFHLFGTRAMHKWFYDQIRAREKKRRKKERARQKRITRNFKGARYTSYEMVFIDVPGKAMIAIYITECPHKCPGCHSPELWKRKGKMLNEAVIDKIYDKYRKGIDGILFMGDSRNRNNILELAKYIRSKYSFYKIGWYSGFESLPFGWGQSRISNFDYIKLGPYKQELGALNSKTTNQKFYKLQKNESGKIEMIDRTHCFRRKIPWSV
jgi:anaerobic ribonucleoside-triphosphate reductase activating protein